MEQRRGTLCARFRCAQQDPRGLFILKPSFHLLQTPFGGISNADPYGVELSFESDGLDAAYEVAVSEPADDI